MWETNFLQSSIWADFQKHQKHQIIEKKTKNYSYLAIVERGKFSNRLYCPLGPLAKDIDSLDDALKDLKKQARRRHLDFVRIEPTLPHIKPSQLRDLGLRHARRDVQPPHTVINDVSTDIQTIEATLSQTARRYARKCDKAGITYRVSYKPSDIDHFIKLIHEVSDRTGMVPHPDTYFQKIATFLFPKKAAGLLLAELNKQPIAAVIYYSDGKTMYYAHAANSTEHRKLSPATGLGLFALKFAHQSGCQIFDWFGTAPIDNDKNRRWKAWQGFTRFKLSFGGERVNRAGTWELPLKKGRYLIYRTLLALARK